jgi:hypothetical protein
MPPKESKITLHNLHIQTLEGLEHGTEVSVKLASAAGHNFGVKKYVIDKTLNAGSITLTSDHSDPRLLSLETFLVLDVTELDAIHPRTMHQPPAPSLDDIRALIKDTIGPAFTQIDSRVSAFASELGSLRDAVGRGSGDGGIGGGGNQGLSARGLDGIDRDPPAYRTFTELLPVVQLPLGKPQVLEEGDNSLHHLAPGTRLHGGVLVVNEDSKSVKHWRIMKNLNAIASPSPMFGPFSVFHLLSGTREEVLARLSKLEFEIPQQLQAIELYYAPKPPPKSKDEKKSTWVMPVNAAAMVLRDEATCVYIAALRRIAAGRYPQSPMGWFNEVLWLAATVLSHSADKNRPHPIGGSVIYSKLRTMLNDTDEAFTYDPAALYRAL